MALSNTERQQRYYKRKIATGEVVRFELRVPSDQARAFRELAAIWGCSLTEAITRACQGALEQARPAPASTETGLGGDQGGGGKKTPVRASAAEIKPTLHRYGDGGGYSVQLGEFIAGNVKKSAGVWHAYQTPGHRQAGRYRTRAEAVMGLLRRCERGGQVRLPKGFPPEPPTLDLIENAAAIKPTLKEGGVSGQWRVLVGTIEIGQVASRSVEGREGGKPVKVWTAAPAGYADPTEHGKRKEAVKAVLRAFVGP